MKVHQKCNHNKDTVVKKSLLSLSTFKREVSYVKAYERGTEVHNEVSTGIAIAASFFFSHVLK